MKWLLDIVGVVLALFGIVWILQGTDILTTGFMAGHIQYAILGVIVAIVGVGVVVLANRRHRGTPTASR